MHEVCAGDIGDPRGAVHNIRALSDAAVHRIRFDGSAQAGARDSPPHIGAYGSDDVCGDDMQRDDAIDEEALAALAVTTIRSVATTVLFAVLCVTSVPIMCTGMVVAGVIAAAVALTLVSRYVRKLPGYAAPNRRFETKTWS